VALLAWLFVSFFSLPDCRVLLFCSYLMRKVMENIERLGSMSKLLILGDALFYKLSKTKERWQPLEQRYAAINLGAPGDRTENILKRFEDGQHLLNITSEGPTMLLQVGASNALLRDSPSAIMAGIDAVLSLLRTHLKKPRFILLSLLPRGFPGAPVNETIREVNTLLSAEYGLKRHEDVEYANVAKVRDAPLVPAHFSRPPPHAFPCLFTSSSCTRAGTRTRAPSTSNISTRTKSTSTTLVWTR
jgi:hypothetical protein